MERYWKYIGIWLIIPIVILFSGISGCKHQPIVVDDMIPTDTTDNPVVTPCDPDTVYFEQQILPLLVSNCAMPGCHSASNPQDGVNLTSYQKVMQTADIKPGKLDGDLWEAINETKADKRMPRPPSAPLTAAQIALIRTWLLQGAQNLACDDQTGPCDSSNMSFTNDILPILQVSCIGCHGGTQPQAGINLSNFSGVSAVIGGGRLLGAIKREQGFKPMPPAGSPLADCNIEKIEAWINQGAKNN